MKDDNTEHFPVWVALCSLGGLPPDASIDRVHHKVGVLGRGTFQRARDLGKISAAALRKLGAVYGQQTADLMLANADMEVAPGLPSPLAQDMSHVLHMIAHTPTLTRGAIESMSSLPEAFRLVMEDDALAPRAPKGSTVTFLAGIEPRAGDGILVKDSRGSVHARMVRLISGNEWEAVASDGMRWRSLHSRDDGLVVLAVVSAVDQRWG